MLHYNNEITDIAWQKTPPASRKTYMVEIAPSKKSTIPDNGLPPQFQEADPSLEDSEAGRKNFGVVATSVNWLEWLWLNSKGHRRAAFNYNVDKTFDATWLIP
ncbi:MAG: hypothetical protein ACKVOM_10245 [Ferruginibacter sp.]